MDMIPASKFISVATNKMPPSPNARLIAEFKKNATLMIDVEHLVETIHEGMETDIKTGDKVISTNYYEGGMFVVPQLKKFTSHQRTTLEDGVRSVERYRTEEDLPNPYTESVTNNNEESRMKSLSVKCKAGCDNARTEMRIKVRKMCLFRWKEDTQSYPTMSSDIIFRQRIISFAEKFKSEHSYYSRIFARPDDYTWMPEDEKEKSRIYLAMIERLIAIPPFICFYDEKYGFLVRRRLTMSRIVMSEPRDPDLPCVETAVVREVNAQVKEFKEHLKKREDVDMTFREKIVAEAMKPERVERKLEKLGMEGLEATFEASVEARGTA